METFLINNKIPFRKYANYILPCIAILVSVYLLKNYFTPSIQIVLGVLLAPFIFTVQKNNFSYRYLYVSVLFLIAYYFLQVYVLLFLSAGCFVLFTIESQNGKIGVLPFLFLITISPAMHYVVNTFTFSLRLELSQYSALLLNKIGIAVQNKGSYFIMPDGREFNVDTACIGLNLFNTGLALMLLLIGFSEKRTSQKLNLFSVSIILLMTVICLIATNLFRIVGLVLFESPPETFQHELIGIASLILYTLTPIYFLISFLQKKQPKKEDTLEVIELQSPAFKRNVLITLLTSIFLITISYKVNKQKENSIKDEKLANLNLEGYSKQLKEDGVIEFTKNDVLIYIKPSAKGYASDHPPSICWQGAGFKLEKVAKTNITDHEILSAILKKDTIIQYTAWWYDNGTDKTINQWKWRLTKGEPYRIINITSYNKQTLDSLCSYYLKQNLF